MARFSVRADFVDRSKLISRQIKRTMEGAVLDVTLDMKRVASMSAPHKSGFWRSRRSMRFMPQAITSRGQLVSLPHTMALTMLSGLMMQTTS